MKFDPVLAAMLAEPWSNNACRGYVIYAMENCGFSPEDIRRVVGELYYENGNISVKCKFADEFRKIAEYIEINTSEIPVVAG